MKEKKNSKLCNQEKKLKISAKLGWFNYGIKHKIITQDSSISELKSKKVQNIIINFNKNEIEELKKHPRMKIIEKKNDKFEFPPSTQT